MFRPRHRPPASGTATAALLITVLGVPCTLISIPTAVVTAGPAGVVAVAAAFILAPQILGWVALREVKQGRAHPISRQRALLAMGISGVELLLAAMIFLSWLTGG